MLPLVSKFCNLQNISRVYWVHIYHDCVWYGLLAWFGLGTASNMVEVYVLGKGCIHLVDSVPCRLQFIVAFFDDLLIGS